MTTILVGRDQAYLNQPWVSARTIRVNTTDVGVLDFDLSDKEKAALYDEGLQRRPRFPEDVGLADYVTRFR